MSVSFVLLSKTELAAIRIIARPERAMETSVKSCMV